MAYFNFSRVIQKYSSEFTAIIKGDGYFDDTGKWVQAETAERKLNGAIMGFKESKVYRLDGVLTSQDKTLFMLEPIEKALLGATVIYEGDKYNVEVASDSSKFTNVYMYTLKYISAFNQKQGAVT